MESESEYVYWTSWWHIKHRSLGPGNAWKTMALLDRSHVRVISSRRYPGHWCKLHLRWLMSFGDLTRTWCRRELDEDIRDQFRRSSKHRPIDFKLWFVVPISSHHTSRRGFRLGFIFFIGSERFNMVSFSERLKVLSSCSKVTAGRPSLSYTSNSRSGESSGRHSNIFVNWGEVNLSSTCHIE